MRKPNGGTKRSDLGQYVAWGMIMIAAAQAAVLAFRIVDGMQATGPALVGVVFLSAVAAMFPVALTTTIARGKHAAGLPAARAIDSVQVTIRVPAKYIEIDGGQAADSNVGTAHVRVLGDSQKRDLLRGRRFAQFD